MCSAQVSQRAFSRFGIKPRGDTTAWTDTPQSRSAREREALLGGVQGPLLIAGGGWRSRGVLAGAQQQVLGLGGQQGVAGVEQCRRMQGGGWEQGEQGAGARGGQGVEQGHGVEQAGVGLAGVQDTGGACRFCVQVLQCVKQCCLLVGVHSWRCRLPLRS